ncbi:hypothetical protein ACIQM4_09075 [Streptomyces sp. NPDC091272]|uniref:hypothetical protein n=1 Tax=Streptomyces sp. NPDC091272 TaxID=3365981 RepID=UPI00381111C0
MSSLLRKGLFVLVVAGLLPLVPLGAGGTAFAGPTGNAFGGGARSAALVGEADLAHHGQVVYGHGRLAMQLRTWNHGPQDLTSGAVRVSFSAPVELADGKLPRGCARSAPAALVCETGPLRAGSLTARTLGFDLRVGRAPDEVVVEVRTERMAVAEQGVRGPAQDLNPGNDRQRVVAPDTGDVYYF